LGAGLVLVTALMLCLWQIRRDGERNQYLALARSAWEMPPLDQVEMTGALDQYLFRDVILVGQFEAPIMLEGGRRVGSLVGYGVLQPFATTDGRRLLVNRGNLRRSALEPGLQSLALAVEVVLAGQLRPLGGSADASPVLSQGLPPIWGRRSIAAIHAWAGGLVPGIYLWAGERLETGQEAEPSPLLASGYGPVLRDNTSLHYAKQWFALAVIIGLLWGWASFEANQRR
jgi:cytochrome oxidase assembly protein ShyY1